MSVAVDEETFWLGDWRVEPLLNRIVRGEEIVRIDPRNMKVLQLLASQPGHVFSQAEIEQAVWQDVIVTSNSVYQSIAQLRRALEDGRQNPRYIETIPRRGYRTVADVKPLTSEPAVIGHDVWGAVRSACVRLPRQLALRGSYISIFGALIGALTITVALVRPNVAHQDTRTESLSAKAGIPIEGALDELLAADTNATAPRFLVDLGHTALNQGRWKKAQEYFEQALAIEQERVGRKHPAVAELLSELANVSIWGSDYAGADRYARAALSALEGMPDSYEPLILATRRVGYVLLESGQYAQSEPYLIRALDLSRRAYGDTIANTAAVVLTDLALLRLGQGNHVEAERFAREATDLLNPMLNEEMNQSRASLALSLALIAQSRFHEAKKEAERNLRILHGVFAENHVYIVAGRDVLARSLIGLGEYALAEDVLRRNVELWRQHEGMTQRMAASLSTLCEALLGQKRIAQAEECLRLASAEIDNRSMARQERLWLQEHQERLRKLRIVKAELARDEVQLAEAND